MSASCIGRDFILEYRNKLRVKLLTNQIAMVEIFFILLRAIILGRCHAVESGAIGYFRLLA